MAQAQLNGVVRHLRALRDTQALAEASDAQLLQRFTAAREEVAFTLLLRRHGPMVLGIARRLLGNAQDAEDVFQAAFLLLARKAGSIRKRESVGSWLYGVTRRLALKARRQGVRRQMRERRAADLRGRQTGIDSAWQDVPTILDTALGELPECYRAALVMCYLEGKTHAEAARQLGCPLATLRTRVARGRNLLRDRLARHGLTLSAAGLFTLLVASAASAAAPAELVRAAVKAALPIAAGQPAATLCPARVADLVEGGLSTMFLSKTKVATLALLAAGLLAGTGALVRMQPAAAESGVPPATEKAKPATPSAGPDTKDQDKEAITFAGRVLDPDGKPSPAAKLYVLYEYDAPKAQPVPVRATSDAEGRFRFRVKRTDFGRSLPWVKAPPWENATVVAVARGHGLGMPQERGKPSPRTGLTLRLAKDDTPLRGRILDLQGKPIAGVTVRVQGLLAPVKGDLSAFVNALKDKKEVFPPMMEHLSGFEWGWMGHGVGTLFEPATTGIDGRFQIKGIGPERLVKLRIEGPTIATRDVCAMTRPGETIQAPGYRRYLPNTDLLTVHGNGFTHIPAPCLPIVGVVRDKDTGKPIPGAVVTSYKRADGHVSGVTDLRAVADKDGRYRLLGMPKGDGNVIRAGPPDGEPYLMSEQRLGNAPGLGPVTADFALKRGVWITGRVLDKVTRQPVPARVEYVVFADNPHRKEVRGLSVDIYLRTRVEDGTFRTVGLPGRGLLAARAWNGGYRFGIGADKIRGMREDRHFFTYPHLVFANSFHTFAEINPATDAKQVTCDLLLDSGRTVKGEVRGPDGKPLAGVRVSGLERIGSWEDEPLKTSTFLVTGLAPGEPRLLQFAHPGRKLAGSLVLQGDEKGPLTVQLQPAATLTGRLVTPDGQPATDGAITAIGQPLGRPMPAKEDLTIGRLPADIRPGKDGKFRIEGLAPRLVYYLGFSKGSYLHQLGGAAGGKLTVKPGQTIDLGDVVVKPIE